MVHTLIGAGVSNNYWQGDNIDEIASPRNGDTFLDVGDGTLYTFHDGDWMPINGGSA